MPKIKRNINQQNVNTVEYVDLNWNNVHSLEVVNRVNEARVQVNENSN